jgi:hypothetical protein
LLLAEPGGAFGTTRKMGLDSQLCLLVKPPIEIVDGYLGPII